MKIRNIGWLWGTVAMLLVVGAGCSATGASAPDVAERSDPAVPSTSAPAHTPAASAATAADETGLPTGTPTPSRSTEQDNINLAPGRWPDIVLTQTLSGLNLPVDLGHAKDGSGRLYVVEQMGMVQVFTNGVKSTTPFLDIRDRVNCCGEKGLLGIAFPPDFASSRQVYVNYTTMLPGSLHTRVSRFTLRSDAHQADPDSEELILQFPQPYANHNGGQIVFGPKGNLWVGTGDGGSGGDPHDNGQKGQTLLGKLLRIDVSSSTDARYAVPADNPFIDNDEFLDEIWAYGLRNPWRFSFDRQTGDLYIADVGQNVWEEVNFQPAASPGGENYGWRITEGLHCFQPSAECVTIGLTLPVAEYDHNSGQSITGGYVFRGASQPSLWGIYFYADYVSGRIWGLRHTNGQWEAKLFLDSSHNVSSFGEDEAGNLYVVTYSGAILQIQAAIQE